MKDKQIVAIVGVVVVALVATGWWFWKPSNNENFPEGTLWLCTSKTCGQHFAMTMEELGAYNKAHFGEEMKCPKCKSLAVRAIKCPNCGKIQPQQYGVSACQSCGKSLYLTGKE